MCGGAHVHVEGLTHLGLRARGEAQLRQRGSELFLRNLPGKAGEKRRLSRRFGVLAPSLAAEGLAARWHSARQSAHLPIAVDVPFAEKLNDASTLGLERVAQPLDWVAA